MDQRIVIAGKQFELVRVQRDGLSFVYKGDGEYLRIGEPRIIRKHLNAHILMAEAGYPVPQFVTSGEHEGKAYFVEKSVGERRLGDLFADDWQANAVISDEHFRECMEIIDRVARAQLRAPAPPDTLRDMKSAIHIRTLSRELPAYAGKIEARYTKAKKRLSVYPIVLSHGDFNPQNLFPNGIIDLEHAFRGPWGYDILTLLVHIDQFPLSNEYEYFARYQFSDVQRKTYLAKVDGIVVENNLPALSNYIDDISFCRAVWSAVRMHGEPKLQKWRWEKLISSYLS